MRVARIHDDPPGRRFLVDRLWPRGVSKGRADLTGWLKELAPSTGLRKAYHEGLPWDTFEAAYREELESVDLSVLPDDAVLVTAARATPNHADVLLAVAMERRQATAIRAGSSGHAPETP